MAIQPEITSVALFCDFEIIAFGVRDAKFAQFDIRRGLERLLLKGSIVVKKAQCDCERYKKFKAALLEAAFELIEIPHWGEVFPCQSQRLASAGFQTQWVPTVSVMSKGIGAVWMWTY